MVKLISYSVTATNVGRRDYSVDIEKSVDPLASDTAHQIRANASFAVPPVPTPPYPFAYWTVLGYLGHLAILPGYAQFGYDVIVSGDTPATTFAGIQIYDNYDPITDTPSNLYQTLAMVFAPKVAEIHFAKGLDVRPWANKYFLVLFAHYSANPFTLMNLTFSALIDQAVYDEYLSKLTVGHP